MQIKNAVVTNISLSNADHGLLSAWLYLDYGGVSQGFGGYGLYLPKSFKHFTEAGDFCGHFVFRCLEICGVDEWNKIVGKSLRAACNSDINPTIEGIGHIVKEDWFYPKRDFDKMKANNSK